MTMKAGVNIATAGLVIGVVLGLALTPDGRGWLRHPTLLLGSTAQASASPETAPPAPAPTVVAAPVVSPGLDRRAPGQPLRIGIVGDSMGGGVYTGISRALADESTVTVINMSQPATGLARYDFVDVQAKTVGQLDAQPIDVAVVVFGTNDGQGVELDGVVYPFASDGWKAMYTKRVDDLVELMRSRGVAVYWVGLPTMKNGAFNARIAQINALVAERLQVLGVPFLDTTAITRNADGVYDAYLAETGTGARRLMRANDGIHMSTAGYLRLSEPIVARIRHDAGLDASLRHAAVHGDAGV